jgi:hypothetical protein
LLIPHSIDIEGVKARFVGYEQLSVLVIFDKRG